MDLTDRLRMICLALPEATEKEAWGDPIWRIRDKIFAMLKRGDGRPSVWMKAPEGAQDMLVGATPDRFYRPPYVGHKGWIGIRLDTGPKDGEPDWDEIAHHLRKSFELTAPKRILKQMEIG